MLRKLLCKPQVVHNKAESLWKQHRIYHLFQEFQIGENVLHIALKGLPAISGSLKKEECSLFTNFESIEPASNDYLIGSKDCPGDEKVSQSSFGECVGNIKSRSMWKSSNNDFFNKNHRVEAFDPTAVVLTGGYGGGRLKSAELLHGPKSCRIPDLPEAVSDHVLLLTSNGDNILNCGGFGNKNCYSLEIQGERWNQHSTLTQVRDLSTAVTMANGVYIFGGWTSPTTS